MEGSWATFNSGEVPSGPVFYGTEGTIVCDRHSTQIKIYKQKAHGHSTPTEVIDCANYTAGSLTQHILEHLLENKPLHPLLQPELNVNVMAILGGGRQSAETGKTVKF
jgi:predicted dehydrogenase